MPWANLDDQFPKHPKVVGLSDGAFRLHVAGICYCAQYKTDGRIDSDAVSTLVPRYKAKTLEDLLGRRLWLPVANGYEIHDYLQWNRSRADIEAEQDRLHKLRSAAGRKGAQVRWHKQ